MQTSSKDTDARGARCKQGTRDIALDVGDRAPG
jgi:hypothetical protein